MKKIIPISILILAGTLAFLSCKKEYDLPPVKQANDGAKITIAAIKSKFFNNINYKFKNDSNLYCTVIADEVSGNLYKDVYVRDATGAIHVALLASGGLFVGDSIRINLKGVLLNEYSDLIQLDSVDLEKNIVKLASGLNPQPEVMTISQIVANTAATNTVQSRLVKIENVQFSPNTGTFADPIGKASVNQTITTCTGQKLTVRTSGYSNFAGQSLPTGNGSIIAIASQYGSTMQLVIRNFSEVQMTGPVCSTTFAIGSPVNSINEQFNGILNNTVFSQSGWINHNEVGSAKWEGDITSSTYKSLVATAYNSGDASNAMWLITPPVIYTSTMTLSFKAGYGFWDAGHTQSLMAYVSTDFNGTNFETANWTPITAATYPNGTGGFYTGSAGMNSSGVINLNTISILNGYSGNFFVAWKHTGSNPNYNSNIYIDDILIQ